MALEAFLRDAIRSVRFGRERTTHTSRPSKGSAPAVIASKDMCSHQRTVSAVEDCLVLAVKRYGEAIANESVETIAKFSGVRAHAKERLNMYVLCRVNTRHFLFDKRLK